MEAISLSDIEQDFKQGKYEDASSKLDALINKEPSEDLYYNKALCLYFLKDYKDAYEVVIELGKNEKVKALIKALQKKLKSKHNKTESNADGLIKQLKFFKSDITFDNVVGLQKEKQYLKNNIILLIKKPELAKEYGKKLADGCIIYGSPGTGKTLLAKAISGETQANMLIIKKQDILNMYVGNGEKNLHTIFEQARKNAPCIIFIDEIDSLTNKRSDPGDSKGEGSAMVNLASQLLEELDGIEKNPEGLFVIGATNLPWKIDSAFKRGGRFSTMLYISPPTFKERMALFQYYMAKMKKGIINYNRLALTTTGYAAGDIATIADKSTLPAMIDKDQKGIDRLITTQDVINTIKTLMPRPSLDEWYMDTRKELLGTIESRVEDNKLIQSWRSGRLESQERNQYRELLKDVSHNTRPMTITIKMTMRRLGAGL